MTAGVPNGETPFLPHPLLGGFHRQTVAGAWPRSGPPVTERQIVRVDEGTSLLTLCSWQPADAPTLVVLHGLTGDADRPYMRSLGRTAWAAGCHVVRVNTRNCGGTEHLTETLYHAGLEDDLAAVVDTLVAAGRGPLLLAGFSMGGNIALRLAARWGDGGPSDVLGVASVSPSLDLPSCAERIDGDPGLAFYRRAFLRELRAVVRRKAARFPERFDVDGLEAVDTIRGFDDGWTAPAFGFGEASRYYREASALPVLGQLTRPTLIIQSRDDRLVPADGAGRAARASPAIRVLLTERGGHCGFAGRRPPPGGDRDRWWADHRIVAFFAELLSGDGRGRPSIPTVSSPHQLPRMG